MTTAVVSILILSFIFLLMYKAWTTTHVENYYEEPKPTPVFMGKHTVYLREEEMKAWESLPRNMKREAAKEFEKRIRKGELYPVKQEDGTILYATKERNY